MFEFLLTGDSENPTAFAILITVLSTFFLSALIVLTYEGTNRRIERHLTFLQSMVLVAIVAATVMQAIGDSLARGLGMLGALAVIRFRTRVENPRNMAFMFAALATGIACGVFGFTIAFIGTLGFCAAAWLLHWSPLSRESLGGSLRIEIPKDSELEPIIACILQTYCTRATLDEVRFPNLRRTRKIRDVAGNVVDEAEVENLKELSYAVRLRRQTHANELLNELEALPDIRALRLRFEREDQEI